MTYIFCVLYLWNVKGYNCVYWVGVVNCFGTIKKKLPVHVENKGRFNGILEKIISNDFRVEAENFSMCHKINTEQFGENG